MCEIEWWSDREHRSSTAPLAIPPTGKDILSMPTLREEAATRKTILLGICELKKMERVFRKKQAEQRMKKERVGRAKREPAPAQGSSRRRSIWARFSSSGAGSGEVSDVFGNK